MPQWAEPEERAAPSDEPLSAADGAAPPSAVERLFREHNDSLLRFLRARLKSDSDAREAAQEAYVRLLQLDQSNQPSFLRAYLFKIASNVATDMLRRRGQQARTAAADTDHPLSGPAQEAALLARQQLQFVQDALCELPPRCREAFLLKRQDELSTSEIGARLGVSDRMIRLYLARAIEHVQCALDHRNNRGPAR